MSMTSDLNKAASYIFEIGSVILTIIFRQSIFAALYIAPFRKVVGDPSFENT